MADEPKTRRRIVCPARLIVPQNYGIALASLHDSAGPSGYTDDTTTEEGWRHYRSLSWPQNIIARCLGTATHAESRSHHGQFRKGMGPHLAHNLAAVSLDRNLADAEFTADLAVPFVRPARPYRLPDPLPKNDLPTQDSVN